MTEPLIQTEGRPARSVPGVRPARLAVLAAVVALLLAACGGAATMDPSVGAPDVGTAPEVAPVAEGGGAGRPADGSVTTAYDPGGAGAELKVIKTGSVTLEVDSIEASVEAARVAIDGLGGYVAATQISNNPGYTFASITYRIPADRWDEALAALRGIAREVLDEQTGIVEVTAQVVDLEARLRNLKATETQLLAILEKATRITDILEVQVQLTDVRGQIESLTAELGRLEDQVALGTLTVQYTLPVVAVEEATEGWDVGKIVDGAVAALIGLGQGLVALAIWLVVVALPVVVVGSLLLAVAGRVGRRLGIRLPSLRLPSLRRRPPAA
ncbi:MAG: hypothetical protein RL338_385 [Chloroflexota bacterium]|jgi:hypothetical protein